MMSVQTELRNFLSWDTTSRVEGQFWANQTVFYDFGINSVLIKLVSTIVSSLLVALICLFANLIIAILEFLHKGKNAFISLKQLIWYLDSIHNTLYAT